MIHLWPCLGVMCNFVSTFLVMKKDHGYLLIPVGISYSITNYFATKSLNINYIYWFLDWSQPFVYLVLIVIHVLTIKIHYYIAELTIKYRGHQKKQ